jgi:hypothetical protein
LNILIVRPFCEFSMVRTSFGRKPHPQSRTGAAFILAIVSVLKMLMAAPFDEHR